jgi:hypothetical protein
VKAHTGTVWSEKNECPICHAKGRDGVVFENDGSEFSKQKCNSCGQEHTHLPAGEFLVFNEKYRA